MRQAGRSSPGAKRVVRWAASEARLGGKVRALENSDLLLTSFTYTIGFTKPPSAPVVVL